MYDQRLMEIRAKYPASFRINYMDRKDRQFLKSQSYEPSTQPYKNNVLVPINEYLKSVIFGDDSDESNKEIEVITYAIAQTLKNGYSSFKMSFDIAFYTGLNLHVKSTSKSEKQELINYNSLQYVVNTLVDKGYLVKFKGGKDHRTNYSESDRNSCKTVLAITNNMLKLFDGIYLKTVNPQENWFELRQRDTKDSNNRKGKTLAVNDEIAFSNNKIYKRALTGLNKLTRKNVITQNGYQWQPQYQSVGLAASSDLSEWDRDMGMRLYGGGFQCLESGKYQEQRDRGLGRQTLRINYNDVVEGDYSAMHITMCYLVKKQYLNPELDPYHLPNFYSQQPEGAQDQARALVKYSVNVMFNARDFKAAEDSITREYNTKKRSRFNKITSFDTTEMMNEIIEMHSPIADMFCSDTGVKLQAYDSMIAVRVVDHFVKKSIVCLPYHDSFVVEAVYKDELIDVMKKAWCKVFRVTEKKVAQIKVDLFTGETEVAQPAFHEPVDRYEYQPFESITLEEATSQAAPVEVYESFSAKAGWTFNPDIEDQEPMEETLEEIFGECDISHAIPEAPEDFNSYDVTEEEPLLGWTNQIDTRFTEPTLTFGDDDFRTLDDFNEPPF